MTWSHALRRHFLTGLLVLVPAWGTFLILQALVSTLDAWIEGLLGPAIIADIPGLGLLFLAGLILLTGVVGTQFLGQRLVRWTEARLIGIPFVRSIYLTLQGMTDLFKFRERFGRSTVVAFPFPRNGLWALGFVMGAAPVAVQRVHAGPLLMLFVPTAIHPFTGYLAFMPRAEVLPIDLPVEEAMKVEFSAGLYRPRTHWLKRLPAVEPGPGGAA